MRAYLTVMLSVILCLSLHSESFASGWTLAPDMPIALGNTSAAMDNQGRIYIPGGATGKPAVPQSTLLRFDETAAPGSRWSILPASLQIARYDVAVASDQSGRIYAIGGTSESSATLSSVERYDPGHPEVGWTSVVDLPFSRTDAMAVTDSTGKIYVAGGRDASDNVLGSVEVYDPTSNSWSHFSDMLDARTYFAAAIDSSDRIYAIGGWNSSGFLSSAERYDPVLGTWSYVDGLNSPRDVGVAIAGMDDAIYAIGGWAGNYTNVVERFNQTTELWEDFDPLNVARNNMAGIMSESGVMYVFGGDASYWPVATVEQFVPEPATLSVLALGGLAALIRRRRR